MAAAEGRLRLVVAGLWLALAPRCNGGHVCSVCGLQAGYPCCMAAGSSAGTCSAPDLVCNSASGSSGICQKCGDPGGPCCPGGGGCSAGGCCYGNSCVPGGSACG